ncbi:MAG TPA: hypothetical protein PKA64_05710 [Myxococcota bacterium]|nr:hypothetical protein [Myxococcota bacterium]
MRRSLGIALISCGCARGATVDDACPPSVQGPVGDVDPAAKEALLRVQCHRRFVGLPAGRATASAQLAADSHATYLELNDVLSGTTSGRAVFDELPGSRGFTGVSLGERLLAAGAVTEGQTFGAWEALLPDALTGADDWFRDPYVRDALLQPGWAGAGVSHVPVTGGAAAYINVVYDLPSNRRVTAPILYPRDGQVDVPTTFSTYGLPGDPLSAAGGAVGFPITITVGSTLVEGRDNPYQLRVDAASVIDADDGTVLELIIVEPTALPFVVVSSTAILAPIEPLLPGHAYEIDAEVSWNMGAHRVRGGFRTASGSDEQP